MIVATAGHVDHGKTELIKALTGVDTDRLPEEKKRGLTIDLGFVYESLGDGITLGFVDVPGHEKFIRNMMAGVAGIDSAMLVVAADDGVMPQTVEHSAILDLLGIRECMVVITKIDRVGEQRVAEVAGDIQNLLAATRLTVTGTYPVCAPRTEGIDPLRRSLANRARRWVERAAGGNFRLAIDRCFNLQGIGLIVTGTVFSGRAAVDDRMVLSPCGLPVRIRGIHANNSEALEALPGQRCALNLSGKGLSKSLVSRGDWILDSAIDVPSRRIDAKVRVLSTESRALKHWTPVHLHLGAAHVMGRVAVLGQGAISPGKEGLVQLVLNADLPAVFGDRFVLRDQSASRTMGGGRIIDPFAPKRGRAKSERLAWLDAMAESDHALALAGVLALSPAGVLLKRFQQTRNVTDQECAGILASMQVRRIGRGLEERLLETGHWVRLQEECVAAVRNFHTTVPESLGPNPNEMRQTLPTYLPMELVDEALGELVARDELVQRGNIYHLADHQARLGDDDVELWQRVQPILKPADGCSPTLHEAAGSLGMEVTLLKAFVKRAARAGMVLQVKRNRFVPVNLVHQFATKTEQCAASNPDGRFTTAEFRDIAGIGRNFAVDLLEFFDRSRFTERLGDERRLRRSASQVFGGNLS